MSWMGYPSMCKQWAADLKRNKSRFCHENVTQPCHNEGVLVNQIERRCDEHFTQTDTNCDAAHGDFADYEAAVNEIVSNITLEAIPEEDA